MKAGISSMTDERRPANKDGAAKALRLRPKVGGRKPKTMKASEGGSVGADQLLSATGTTHVKE
jgi:hypothetical protein